MKSIFSLSRKPWSFTILILLAWIFSIILISNLLFFVLNLDHISQIPQPWPPILSHILAIFVIAPFVLGFSGKKFSYRDFLSEIRLTRMKPILQLFLLGLTCYLIIALSQAAGVLVFRLSQGQSIDWSFIRYTFVLTRELPPQSDSWFQSIPSIFEEITFRGLVLAIFLRFYSKSKAILFSSIVFGLMHILTIADGRPPVWSAGQVLWAAILGIFYGYVTIKSNSLLPAMMVHYLSNLFVSAINGYIQNNAAVALQAIYGVIFTFGIVPSLLMILWTRFFANRWLISQKKEIKKTDEQTA